MTTQDFKALLDALNRISKAIEGKTDNRVVKTVNRFAEVFRMLVSIQGRDWNEGQRVDDFQELKDFILEIQKKYAKIAEEVLNEKD